MGDSLVGKIIKIDGVDIVVEIAPQARISEVDFSWDVNGHLISMHKYLYSYLPCKRRIISRITSIYEKEIFSPATVFKSESKGKYLVSGKLIAIYDDYIK